VITATFVCSNELSEKSTQRAMQEATATINGAIEKLFASGVVEVKIEAKASDIKHVGEVAGAGASA
jgi:hypothetical protein